MNAVKVFIILLMLISLSYPASADSNVTVDLTDLDLTKNVKILVYNHSGERIGEYTSGDNFTLDYGQSQSYIFVI